MSNPAKMRPIDRIVKQYQPTRNLRDDIHVPEWTFEGEEPFKIYWQKAWNVEERQMLANNHAHFMKEGMITAEMSVDILMAKAQNADGTRMFKDGDRNELMRESDPKILERVAIVMLADLRLVPDKGEAAKNSDASAT